MGHVDDREVAVFGEIAQRVEQMLAGENIQSGARLIQEQNLSKPERLVPFLLP